MSGRTGVGVISLALAVAGCGSGAIGGGSDADANDDDADAVCGNGVVEAAEECDDANSIDGDGCNVDCLKSGVVRWCVEYAHPGGADGMSVNVAVGPDGILAAGRGRLSNSPDPFKSWVMDVEFDGSSASHVLVPVSGNAELSIGDIGVSPDGDAILVGYLEQTGKPGAVWLGTRSASGTISAQTYADRAGTIAFSVFYGAKGPIVVGAVGKLGWVAQLNDALQIVWEDQFSILGLEEDATDVAEQADGSIAVVGRSLTDLDEVDDIVSPIFHSFVRTYSPDRAEVTTQIISEDSGQSWVLSAVATSASRTVAGGYAYVDVGGTGYAWTITSNTSQLAPALSNADMSGVHDVALGAGGDTYLVGWELDASAIAIVQKIWHFPDLGSGAAGWELTRGAGEVLSVVTAGSYLYIGSVVPVGDEEVAEVCAVSR
ncbi:hypothetical protein [Enhygromyxa salina]|nr:hypothetical protein [Enhygromyxa salina]